VPAVLVQRLGPGPECGVVVHPEHEVDPPGPPVEVGGQGEVGVTAQADPFGVPGDQVDRLVDPAGRVLMAGDVAGPVHQIQHLLGVGQ